MCSEKRSERRSSQMSRSSRFKLGLGPSDPGVVGVGHGLKEWQVAVTAVSFDPCNISVGFDTWDPGLDLDSLSQ